MEDGRRLHGGTKERVDMSCQNYRYLSSGNEIGNGFTCPNVLATKAGRIGDRFDHPWACNQEVPSSDRFSSCLSCLVPELLLPLSDAGQSLFPR